MNISDDRKRKQRGKSARLSVGGLVMVSSMVGMGSAIAAELEEITVTAQFREQNVQDTPIAITAMDAEMIDRRGYENVVDIAGAAPNVTLKESSGLYAGTTAYIRGIGQFDSQIALEPGVGVYLDDAYIASMAGSNFSLLDLDRIEILRGPQGTLAGANSIGGAIKMYTKKPSGDGDGFFEAGFGSHDTYIARGAFDTTLIEDKLFLRVAGGHKSAGGYVDMIDFACEQPALAGNLPLVSSSKSCKFGEAGGASATSARLALRWLPTDALEVNVSFDKTSTDNDAPPMVMFAQSQISPFYNAEQIAIHGIPYDERFIPKAGSYKTYATYNDLDRRAAPFDSHGYSDGFGFNTTIDYQINDYLSVTSITTYRETDVYGANDGDASPLNGAAEQYFWDIETVTQELRLSGDGDKAEWTVGAYYMKSDQEMRGVVNAQLARAPIPIPNYPYGVDILFFGIEDTAVRKKMAFFANGTYHVTDALGLTLGLRYSDTSFDYVQDRFDPIGQDPLNPGVRKPAFLAHLGAAPQQGVERVDYRVALDYQLNDAMMVYGQIATGFKDGGVNPTATSSDGQIPFNAEKLTSYEIGLKGDFLDNSLRMNAAVFYSDYTDLQIRAVLPNGDAPTTNAGEATIKGLELEAEWLPMDNLLLTASGSYIDFEYGDLGTAGPAFIPTGPCQDCVNRYTPELTAFLAAQYTFELGDNGSWTPRISGEYQDKVYSDINNLEDSSVPSRWIANARLTWESASDEWKATLAINNLFDEYYFDYVRTGLNNLGFAQGSVGRPRELMLTLKKSF